MTRSALARLYLSVLLTIELLYTSRRLPFSFFIFTLTSFTKEPFFNMFQCIFDTYKVKFTYVHSSLSTYLWCGTLLVVVRWPASIVVLYYIAVGAAVSEVF